MEIRIGKRIGIRKNGIIGRSGVGR